MAGTGVDQTASHNAAKHMVETGLVATDTGIDFVGAIFLRLDNKVGVCQEWPGHGYHIGIAAR